MTSTAGVVSAAYDARRAPEMPEPVVKEGGLAMWVEAVAMLLALPGAAWATIKLVTWFRAR